MKKKIIIIGAGLGGLAAGCRLAASGHTVEILEQRASVGGLAAAYPISGFEVDPGPAAFTASQQIEDIYHAAGKPLPDNLQWLPVSPAHRIFDARQRSFDLQFDPGSILEEVHCWDPAAVDACHQYLQDTRAFFSPRFDHLDSLPFLNPLSLLRTLPDIIRMKGLQSTWAFVSRYFEDPFLSAVFALKPFLMGGNPLEVNIYTALHMQKQDTVMLHPAGGIKTIARNLSGLFQELGGKLHLNAEVTGIITRLHQVSGVRMKDGGLRPADIIIANADVADVHNRLLNESKAGRFSLKNAAKLRFSMSMFTISLVTSRRYLDTPLAHHNIFLPEDFAGLLNEIFSRRTLSSHPAIFLHMPTRTDPNLAPPENELMTIQVPVPNLTAGIDWQIEARPLREKVIAFLEQHYLPELRASILAESVITPQDYHKNFNAAFGAPFSLQLSPFQAAWFRPHNRAAQFHNLYLVGAGTHPGPGMAAVLFSAQIVNELIGPA
jgi:phytoene desaturase